MSGKDWMTQPQNLRYLYDGSIAGFYSCVFDSVYTKRLPTEIVAEPDAEPSLLPDYYIETDMPRAKRVRASVPKKMGASALQLLEKTFRTCLAEKELAMLQFLLLGYEIGPKINSMLAHPLVAPLYQAVGHMGRETEKLLGFLRFSDYEGVLGAAITPKNFVLPSLARHFVRRFPNEAFFILDKTHQVAFVFQDGKAELIPVEEIDFPKVSEAEENYRALWKQFYHTISITARENPRCRMTNMPKRYWENMLEVRDELYTPPRLSE